MPNRLTYEQEQEISNAIHHIIDIKCLEYGVMFNPDVDIEICCRDEGDHYSYEDNAIDAIRTIIHLAMLPRDEI